MIADSPDIANGIEDTLIAADFRNDVSNRMRDVLFDFLVDGAVIDREGVFSALLADGVAPAIIERARGLELSQISRESVGYESWKAAIEAFLPEEAAPKVANSDVSWRQRRRMVAERQRQLEERRAADQAEKAIGKADIGSFWKDFEERNPWFSGTESDPSE